MSTFLVFLYQFWILNVLSKYKYNKNGSCKSTFNFEFSRKSRASSNYNLSFCNEYKHKTCCNYEHSNIILNKILPYYDNTSIECQEITSKIFCYDCNPFVGINKLNGICIDTCNEWYNKCKNDYFIMDIQQNIIPCNDNDHVICSKLSTFIKNGHDMCTYNGYNINDIQLNCFDGTIKKYWNKIKINQLTSFNPFFPYTK